MPETDSGRSPSERCEQALEFQVGADFLCADHGVRDVKDAMSREILPALDAAGIQIASATFEITGLPTLRIERRRPDKPASG